MPSFVEYLDGLNKNGGFRKDSPPLYSEIKKEYEEAIAHTRGTGLDVLLKNYRPSETKLQKQSREASLQAITTDAFTSTTNLVIETIDPSSTSISTPDKVRMFMSENDFWSFLQQNVIPNMIDDPNGFVVALPSLPNGAQNELPKVLFWVVNYIDVKEIGIDYLVFCKKTAKTTTYFFVSGNEAAKFVKDDKGNFVEDQTYYVAYEIGDMLPYTQLKGVEGKTKENVKFWQSFYRPAIVLATRAIQQDSDAELMRKTANPLIIKKKEECDNQSCAKGRIYDSTVDENGSECQSCHGTGFKRQTWNINEVIELDAEDFDDIDVAKFVNFAMPPMDGVKYNAETSEKTLARMEKALNLVFIDQAQSGTAKDIDRERSDAMINTIAKNVYRNIVKFCFDITGAFFNETEKTSIALPGNFRKRTVSAILESITALKKEGVPVGVLYPEYRALYEKMYKENGKALKIALYMLANDPLHLYQTVQEKRLAASDSVEFERSKQMPSALDKLAYTILPDTFTTLSDEQIGKELEKLFKLPTLVPLGEENA